MSKSAERISLLTDLASSLHSGNIPTDVVESRTIAAAKTMGTHINVLGSQSSFIVEHPGPPIFTHVQRFPFNTHWNLTRLNGYLDLSDDLIEGKVDDVEGGRRLDKLNAIGSVYPRWLVVIAYAIYSLAVAARIGGGMIEMFAAMIIGIVSGLIHFATIDSRRVDLQKSFIAALCGTLAVLFLTMVLPPFDFAKALFGGITLLVPAMVVALGTHELVSEAIESGVSRLAYGLVRFLMIAFGIGVAVTLWRLMAPIPTFTNADRIPMGIEIVVMIVGGLALALCMQGRRKDVPGILLGVLIGFSGQEVSKALLGGNGSPFATAFILGMTGLIYGHLLRRQPMTVIYPGLLQVVPGFMGTEVMISFLKTGAASPTESLFSMILITMQIAAGLVAAELFSGSAWNHRRYISTEQLSAREFQHLLTQN
ncbi:MAG TPA: threonine/serine exporter family protein [Bdellovibrionales bacterium]|nr:threonine/serine exporter family protein [Bdellovibrionales bacterium]